MATLAGSEGHYIQYDCNGNSSQQGIGILQECESCISISIAGDRLHIAKKEKENASPRERQMRMGNVMAPPAPPS